MGIYKYKIGGTVVNLYDVVGFQSDEDTLIVFTRGGVILYFNSPNDIEDVEAELAALEGQFDALQITWEGYQEDPPTDP